MQHLISRSVTGLIAGVVFGWFTIGAVGVSAQQQLPPPTMTPADSLAWDYPDTTVTAEGVDHFLVTVDAAPAVSVDLTAKIVGQQTYKWKLPALTVGSHTFQVTACTPAAVCSAPVSLTAVMVIQPDPVANVRFIKGS